MLLYEYRMAKAGNHENRLGANALTSLVSALKDMQQKLEYVITQGINDRYRSSDAKIDFQEVYKDLKELKEAHENLEYRVRHFQAQFPKKNILP